MREIPMDPGAGRSFREVFEEFVISKMAKGVSDVTLNNYPYHLKNIAKYLDIERDFDEITKRDIERMAAAMRQKGIKHNSIATYMRVFCDKQNSLICFPPSNSPICPPGTASC